jgi:hypothetical protein
MFLTCLSAFWPLVVAGERSWQRAHEKCHASWLTRSSILREKMDADLWNGIIQIWGSEDESIAFQMEPTHWWNFAASAISCGCLCLMCLFYSGMPPNADKAVLGHTLLFYFAMRFFVNLAATFTSVYLACTSSQTTTVVLIAGLFLWRMWWQVVFINVFKHHYLFTKAKVVSRVFHDGGVMTARVKRLKAAMKMEVAMCFVLLSFMTAAASVALAVIWKSHPIGNAILAAIWDYVFPALGISVGLVDTFFSVSLVLVFVHPLWNSIQKAREAGVSPGNVARLVRTSRNALVGGALAVSSSACLYVVVGGGYLCCRGDAWWSAAHPLVVFLSANSVLNDVGVVVSTGVLDGRSRVIRGWATAVAAADKSDTASGVSILPEFHSTGAATSKRDRTAAC